MRSVLTSRCIRTGESRATAHHAIGALEIHELPRARVGAYLRARAGFACPESGQNFAGGQTTEKLGVTAREMDKLCEAMVKAMAKGPLDPCELREVLGSAVRSLGEQGRKKGLTTTLPVALERLNRRIRRVPVNGRLDQQRYRYTPWRQNPLSGFKLTAEECPFPGRLFFEWGPAAMAEFQAFSGLGVKAARAAVEPLRLEPVEKDSEGC